MSATKFAHSANRMGRSEPVFTHLTRVAALSEEFAAPWGGGWEGRAAGLLHDLGKYGDLFQRRLAGLVTKIDHSTPGARAAANHYRGGGIAVALAVLAHHGGLKSADRSDLNHALLMQGDGSGGRRYAERNIDLLFEEFTHDGGTLPPAGDSLMRRSLENARWDAALLDARMLFSALVDADSRATAAHVNEGAAGYHVAAHGLPLEPARALEYVEAYIAVRRSNSKSSAEIQALRDLLLAACLDGAAAPPGLFTLTAPTGAGKTLAVLSFALRHAALHNLRRVIVVLPYLNIIDQTARTYADIFAPFGPDYLLEDHSLSGDPQTAVESAEDEDTGPQPLRAFVQEWDQAVILTTTVRFFESLFSNMRSDCTKLHNLAQSVILFDEAQTMPPDLAVPTLAALAQLRSHYGSTVLFSTATQPALEALFTAAEAERPRSFAGWHPTEIAKPELHLFQRARRVHIAWPAQASAETPWEDLAAQVAATPQALVIVNLRRHATALYRLVQELAPQGAWHLSTNMCPEHRQATLRAVRAALDAGRPCRLISTQCVEAGVDIDFPAVWRALGPLDSIAQAAGRCNREGKQPTGEVKVFNPPLETILYPLGYYTHATVTLKQMLMDNPALNILDPATVELYFRTYYATFKETNPKLEEAIEAKDLEQTARQYHWIEGEGLNILIPYRPKIDDFDRLAEEARAGRFSATWLREARPLSVSVRYARRIPILDHCEEVRAKGEATGWYILLHSSYYDKDLGLISDGNPDEGTIV